MLHTCHMIDTKANPRTDGYLSGNRSVLGVLKYRPNRSTEPTGNPERVESNRLKHAIYRSGPVRESVLDRPNANSGPNSTGSAFLSGAQARSDWALRSAGHL